MPARKCECGTCARCKHRESAARSYTANKKQIRERGRAHYAKNKKQINAANRASRNRHRAKRLASAKEHYRTHREQRKAYLKRTYVYQIWYRNRRLSIRNGHAPLSMPYVDFEKWFLAELEKGLHCRCCGSIKSDRKELQVDHDHTTGKLRDLICRVCNLIEGLAHDNSQLLAIVKYKKMHG